MKKLPFIRLLALSALGFALTVLSNTLEPAVIGHKVLELTPDGRNTALGFTTFAGLIVASLVQPIVGVLSDRTRSPWGRRMPYFATGTVMVIGCLLLIALAPDFSLLVAGMLLIQLSSNTIQGPWQALIPDHVPESQRGQASSVKAAYDILGLIIGRLVAGQLVGQFPKWGEGAIIAAITLPSLLFIVALVITAISAHEPPNMVSHAPEFTIKQALARSFRVDLRAHPAFGWWFANRFLFWAAFIALNTFLLFFAIDVIKMPQDEAQRYIGQLSTALGAALLVVSIPAGWLADRIGRKPVIIAAGLIAAAGTVVILVAHDLTFITLAAVIVGIGIGMFLAANWALITDIVPKNEAARYLGIANIATAGGSAIARLIGGAMIDPLNRALGSTSAGYIALYAVAALCFLASALVVIPLPAKRPAAHTNAGG